MTPEAAAKTDALIASLWSKNLPKTIERLDLLDRYAAAAAFGHLSEADRQEATSISHKFAGSLGMYGYQRGTEIAMQLEHLFRNLPPAQPDLITPLTAQLRESIFADTHEPKVERTQ